MFYMNEKVWKIECLHDLDQELCVLQLQSKKKYKSPSKLKRGRARLKDHKTATKHQRSISSNKKGLSVSEELPSLATEPFQSSCVLDMNFCESCSSTECESNGLLPEFHSSHRALGSKEFSLTNLMSDLVIGLTKNVIFIVVFFVGLVLLIYDLVVSFWWSVSFDLKLI